MQVKEMMTPGVEFLPPTATLDAAAQIMRDSDCGFLPISDAEEKKLQGVITDRDITVRAVAEGLPPTETRVDQILSNKVLYCYEDDDVEAAAASMREQQVYRLIVLNNQSEKKLCGILSLGDIVRHDQEALGGRVAKDICNAA